MNKQRRKSLEDIHARLMDIQEELAAIRDEEQEAYDNIPDSLKEAEKASAMSDAIYTMEEADSSIESAMDSINELL